MKSSYKQYIHMIKGKTIKSAPIYIICCNAINIFSELMAINEFRSNIK